MVTRFQVYTYDYRGVKQEYPTLYGDRESAVAAANLHYKRGTHGGYLHFVEAVKGTA